MDLSLNGIFALMQYTLRRPRAGARHLLDLGLPISVRWLGFLLVVIGSTIGTHLSINLMPPEQRAVLETMFFSPFRTAMLQGAIWLIIAGLVTFGGRMRGGQGNFADALLLIVWLQFILLCIQVVQVLVGLVVPVLADLIGLAGLGLMLWLLTNFVAELHGFAALWKVFAGLVLGAVVVLFGVALLLTMFVGAPVTGG